MTAGVRVLGIFPHPDDEAYSCGGTLARLAAEGAEVYVLCATAGEAGQDRRAVTDAPAALDGVRAEELARACATLGARPPRFLGLRDSGIGQVNFPAVVGDLVTEIRRVRPQIVLTLGEDGVYGHPDHIALHRLVRAAFASAPGGERFPERAHGPGWRPERLFLTAFPRGMFRPMYDHMLGSEYVAAFRQLDPDKLGVDPPAVGAAVDIRAFAATKLAAIACHASQLRDGDPHSLFPAGLVGRTLTTELFTLGGGEPIAGRLRRLTEGLSPAEARAPLAE